MADRWTAARPNAADRAHWRAELAAGSAAMIAPFLGPGAGPAEQTDLRTWLPRDMTTALHTQVAARVPQPTLRMSGTGDEVAPTDVRLRRSLRVYPELRVLAANP